MFDYFEAGGSLEQLAWEAGSSSPKPVPVVSLQKPVWEDVPELTGDEEIFLDPGKKNRGDFPPDQGFLQGGGGDYGDLPPPGQVALTPKQVAVEGKESDASAQLRLHNVVVANIKGKHPADQLASQQQRRIRLSRPPKRVKRKLSWSALTSTGWF